MPSLSAATYATLDDVRREIANAVATEVADDPNARHALRAVCARIDTELPNCTFLPIIETRYYDARSQRFGGDVSGLDLILDRDLLTLTSVTNGDGSVLSGSDYTLLPKTGAPYNRIRLKANGAVAWTTDAAGDYEDVIAVSGVWATGGGWKTGVDTLSAAVVSTTASTLTLTWSANTDWLLLEPRFSPGQLIRIDSEYMAVLSANDEAKTLTVTRGERGSTAATHLNGATVDVWEVDPMLRQAAARWAMVVMRRMGRDTDSQFDAVTQIATRFAKDIPADVAAVLEQYRPRFSVQGAQAI